VQEKNSIVRRHRRRQRKDRKTTPLDSKSSSNSRNLRAHALNKRGSTQEARFSQEKIKGYVVGVSTSPK
jgi:hypothetical protein